MPEEDISKLKLDKTRLATAGTAGKRARRKKLFYWALALLLLVFIFFLFMSGALRRTHKVEVATVSLVYPSQTFTLLNASGYVVAQRKAAVASKVTGRLVSVNVEEGSRVKKGDVLARLENEDVLAARAQAEANLSAARFSLEQARAELRDAELQFNRNKDLLGKGFVSKSEYDASEARYDKAKAAVSAAQAGVKAAEAAFEEANVSVNYTLVRAPFDGVVLTKNADIGDIVTPIGAAAEAKAAVVTMADMDSLQVEVDVSESNLAQVKVGEPAEIQLDALPDIRFPGVVHMIVPTADRTKATVLVKVRFLEKDPRTLPEMSAKVAFLARTVRPEEERPRTAVSPNAVVKQKGRHVVFLIAGERVREVAVRTGERLGDMVEVTDLKAGDRIVQRPPERMKDGDRIKIIEK